tara:strand:- start:1953 stop:3797 length:1845 start_codon:yes stop_codon:yes gene_type:complete
MDDRDLQLKVLRATAKGRHFLHKVSKAPEVGEASGTAVGAAAAAGSSSGSSSSWAGGDGPDVQAYDSAALGYFDDDDDDDDDAAVEEELRLTNTWEDERGLGEVPIEKRMNPVTAPSVVARGDGVSKFSCFACGEDRGYNVQLPLNVYTTAYRTTNGKVAIECLVQMSDMLVKGQFAAVYERTTCCKKLGCLFGQDLLSADDYCTWVKTCWAKKQQRPQLERGTDRKHQSRIFSDNIILLRVLAMQQPPVLSEEQLRALFEYLVLNSQFIQEREKRYIATAMAALENPHLFPFQFADRQSVVEKMAQIPRNYASRVIFPLVVDTQIAKPKKWVSVGNKKLETAFPKAPDALFVILFLENAKINQFQEVNGRIVHRVPEGAPHAALFTPEGYEDALTKAVNAKPEVPLKFASSADDLYQATSYGNTRAQREMQKMLAALAWGGQRSSTTTGKGVAAAFTCGSRQANSGVHPEERIRGVLKALGYTEEEEDKFADMMVDRWPTGNTVGKEKLNAESNLSKACETIRKVEIVKPHVATTSNPTRERVDARGKDHALGRSLTPVLQIERRKREEKRQEREEKAQMERKRVAMQREAEEQRRQARIRNQRQESGIDHAQ